MRVCCGKQTIICQLACHLLISQKILIRQGAVTEVMNGRGNSKFYQALRYELRRNMAEVSHQLQDSDQGRESDRLFIRTKARIRQLQADIAKVMREHS